MEVIIFSDSSSVQTCFAKLEKTKGVAVTYCKVSEIKKKGSSSPADAIIYADFSGIPQDAYKKNLSMLSSLKRVFGIIDSKGIIEDPASLFHAGASDFISKALFKTGIDFTRIKKVYEYGKSCIPEQSPEPEPAVKSCLPLSGNDWNKIISGKNYTFCFMYIELDNQREIKKRFPGTALEDFTKKFFRFVEKSVSDINGRIWMWTDLGGLILFPFDGKSCPAIFKSLNLMMNRKLICFEEFDYDMLLSYRIAIHIGDTVYENRGDTGKIVSDSINSIHHLKQNFAEAGRMYLTEDAHRFIPAGFSDLFINAGSYEGREIYRLRDLR